MSDLICRDCGRSIQDDGLPDMTSPICSILGRNQVECVICLGEQNMIEQLNIKLGDFHPTWVIIHDSVTSDGREHGWANIRQYHMNFRVDGNVVPEEEFYKRKSAWEGKVFELPWHEIGFHFGVELIDQEYAVRVGRQIIEIGDHCKAGEFNSRSVGICVIGNFNKFPPPIAQVNLTRLLVGAIQRVCKIRPVNVIGHREAQMISGVLPENRQNCPGALFDMASFRGMLNDV